MEDGSNKRDYATPGDESRSEICALLLPVELVDSDFPTERIPVNSENLGRLALVPVCLSQRSLNKFLLENADGLVQKNPFLDHFRHQRLQLLFHGGLPLS
jgi:hypothetical protein